MARKKYDVVAVVGERKDGSANYVRCGVVFESEKGLSIKLDSIPVGNQWNGWMQLFAPKPKDLAQPQPEAKPQADQGAPFDDDIPF